MCHIVTEFRENVLSHAQEERQKLTQRIFAV